MPKKVWQFPFKSSISISFFFHFPPLSLYVDRFRQIEVLQQVTTAFNSLVGGIPGAQKPVESQLSEEARVRRKRVGMLFRNASKKTLSQLANTRDQQRLPPSLSGQCFSPEQSGDLDKRIPLKRASLSPLVEEQALVSEGEESTEITTLPQVKSSSQKGSREMKNVTATIVSPKGATGVPAESFELEEVWLCLFIFYYLLNYFFYIYLWFMINYLCFTPVWAPMYFLLKDHVQFFYTNSWLWIFTQILILHELHFINPFTTLDEVKTCCITLPKTSKLIH